jgi:predicted porin
MRISKTASAALMLVTSVGTASAQSTMPPTSQGVPIVPGLELFGTLDAMAGRFKGINTGVNSLDRAIDKVDAGGLTTSYLGVRGGRDLSGGLTASFELASFVRNDVGDYGRSDAFGPPVNVSRDPFWSRAAWIGLTSKDFGRVRIGNMATLMFVNSITSNALGDSMALSPVNLLMFVNSPTTGGTSWTRSVTYDTPTWNGFYANAAVSVSEGQGGSNYGARVGYAQGALATTFAWQTVKKNPLTFADGTSANNSRSLLWSGSYDFQVAKVFANLGAITNLGTESAPTHIQYTVWSVSSQVPVPGGKVLLAYGSRDTDDKVGLVPTSLPGGNKERKILTLGYDYVLGPQTDAYLVAMHDQTVSNVLPGPGKLLTATGNGIGLGVRYRF